MSVRFLKDWVFICLITVVFSNATFAGGKARKQGNQGSHGTGIASTDPSIPPDDKNLSLIHDANLENVRINEVFPLLDLDSLKAISEVSNQFHLDALKSAKVLVSRIDAIIEKYGGFIQLQNGDEIAASGVSQELWVAVMGNNHSYFKEKKYCPGTYRKVIIKGVPVEMCPDFPMETVAAENRGEKNSGEEFIIELQRIYQLAGTPTYFRHQKPQEYFYADTEGDAAPKLMAHAELPADDTQFLGRYAPYSEIADQAPPYDSTQPSPSGEKQPRSIFDNAPNALGFRRSGVWEWAFEGSIAQNHAEVVGGSWENDSVCAASHSTMMMRSGSTHSNLGPSRLVRIVPFENMEVLTRSFENSKWISAAAAHLSTAAWVGAGGSGLVTFLTYLIGSNPHAGELPAICWKYAPPAVVGFAAAAYGLNWFKGKCDGEVIRLEEEIAQLKKARKSEKARKDEF